MQKAANITPVVEGGARLSNCWSANCPLCGGTYSSKHQLRRHVDTHPRCGECGGRFTSKRSLEAHTCRGA